MRSTVFFMVHRAVVSGRRLPRCRRLLTSLHLQDVHVHMKTLRNFSTGKVCLNAVPPLLSGKEDRFKGVHVKLQDDVSLEDFDRILPLSLAHWVEEGKCAIWLKVPINLSHYIPVAAKHGFSFHHAEGESSTLYKWIKSDMPCLLPRFATHQVGVAGCIVREDTKEVLVIQDRNRHFQLWKFPGGLADLGEDISATAEREVFEETGIVAEFQGILTFRQQHDLPNAFGRSDIYFLCYMKPHTYEIKPDLHEVLRCDWRKIQDLITDSQTSAMTHRVVDLLQAGLEHGFHKVVLASPEFKSIYKGVNYKLHHVDVGLPNLKASDYAHYISSDFPKD